MKWFLILSLLLVSCGPSVDDFYVGPTQLVVHDDAFDTISWNHLPEEMRALQQAVATVHSRELAQASYGTIDHILNVSVHIWPGWKLTRESKDPVGTACVYNLEGWIDVRVVDESLTASCVVHEFEHIASRFIQGDVNYEHALPFSTHVEEMRVAMETKK